MGPEYSRYTAEMERVDVRVGELHVFDTQGHKIPECTDSYAYMVLMEPGCDYEPSVWMWGDHMYYMFDEFVIFDGQPTMEVNYTYEFGNTPYVGWSDFFYYIGPIDHPNVAKYIEDHVTKDVK